MKNNIISLELTVEQFNEMQKHAEEIERLKQEVSALEKSKTIIVKVSHHLFGSLHENGNFNISTVNELKKTKIWQQLNNENESIIKTKEKNKAILFEIKKQKGSIVSILGKIPWVIKILFPQLKSIGHKLDDNFHK